MIKADNVVVKFGGICAVNHVSIHVRQGKITGLIGPNGAGKTTFFNCISGVQKLTEGNIYFEGREISNERSFRLCEAGIARTYQNINLFHSLSVLDNAMTGKHCRINYGFFDALIGSPKMKREEQAAREDALEKIKIVGLEAKKDLMAGQLPYGEQRLLEIARALCTNPKVLLLDEPAAGMNATEKVVLNELILKIAAMGITVLVIEHDMDVIMKISDYVYVMNDGYLLAEGNPKEVQSNPDVITAYLGED